LTSVFGGMPINDVDFFFETDEDLDTAERILASGFGYKLVADTGNALTYVHETTDHKIQFITKIKGNPIVVLDQFDFSINMCAWSTINYSGQLMLCLTDINYNAANGFIMNKNFLYHLSERLLVWNPKGKFVIASLCRAVKKQKQGFKLNAVEVIKLALGINDLKMETYADLKEQLEGIDTLLLKQLTDKLLDKAEEEYNFEQFLHIMNEYLETVFMEV